MSRQAEVVAFTPAQLRLVAQAGIRARREVRAAFRSGGYGLAREAACGWGVSMGPALRAHGGWSRLYAAATVHAATDELARIAAALKRPAATT
ncbi:hypothetical protein [Kineosporia sp. A_224]|uniref:hypothetical protein n=1 Tax=Kineosporia sp. A_224 TaxID=1962180 RepID=UPI000B4BBAF1|nr:hypothetical protein [Kineosporia sp. A_224]